MSIINYASREIQFKIVYYGPALCGKTTNLSYIHQRINPQNRGDLVSLATAADRTLNARRSLAPDPTGVRPFE